jgi:putative ABC transport system permease protein
MLLAAYPRQFRATYAGDMERLFAERYDEARANRRLAGFLLRTYLDLTVSGCAERISRLRVRQRARMRESREGKVMTGWLHDLRYALRLLRRQPGFSLFVVLTLAVGIGANTAVFTVVNGVFLRPLPYEESDRIVAVWGRFDPESGFDFPQFPLSNPEFLDYQQNTKALQDVAAYGSRTATVGGDGVDPERVAAAAVTGNLFGLLRVAPVLGRTFSDGEMVPNGPAVVVLSYGYWQSRFGGDPNVLGRSVPLNGTPATIVGVMPASFAFPRQDTRMWVPFRIDPANPGGRQSHSTMAVGRLAPNVALETAQAELRTMMDDWKRRFPDIHTGHYLFIRPLLEDVAGTIRPALLLLLAATGLTLLIVCANVASVVLARGEARLREMAIRGALGAGGRRLVRLSLIESGLLAVCGGLGGLAIAAAGVRALIAIDPTSIPRATEIAPDARIVVFALGTATLSALLFGLMPAIQGSRADLQNTLRESALTASGGAGRQLFRRGLVAMEVALSVVLVLGAALMIRSFDRLTSVEPGFRPEGLVSASVAVPFASYREPERVESFYAQLLERLRSNPEFTAVSAGSTVPMWSGAGNWDFSIEGRPEPAPGQPAWNAKAVIVRPGYFETLGVPLVRGRFFTDDDHTNSQPVVVINEAMADKFFPGEDPVGRRVRIGNDQGQVPDPWMTVIGISANVRTTSLDEPAPPSYHFLQSQLPRTNGNAARAMPIFIRSAVPLERIVSALRTAVRELDPSLALYDVQTATSVIDQSVSRPRFTVSLLSIFAALGLLLGASGIYGVLAYTVARRTHEIGIRRALGAQPRRVLADVVKGGMAPVFVGLTLGLAVSYWTTAYWRTQLFNVSPTDPVIYGAVALGVLVVASAATLVPARRALRVNPIVALRADG